MRLFPMFLLLGILIGLPACADDKKEGKASKESESTGKDRKGEFTKLKENLDTKAKELQKELRAAKTRSEFEKPQKMLETELKQTSRKIMLLVDENPKDELGFEMLTWVTLNIGDPTGRALELLQSHHLENPQMKELAMAMAGGVDGKMRTFVEKLYDKNPDKEVKGYAALSLATTYFTEADEAETNKDYSKSVKWFEIVTKEYPDLKLPRSDRTTGDLAKAHLFEINNLAIGKPVPDVEGEGLDGQKFKLSGSKGKVIVLDIWATWCGPCRAMIPHERELVKKLKDKPFTLISVSADEDKETVQKFLKKEEMPWTHWWAGPEGALIRNWNIRFYPTIYVIDAKGIIRYKNLRDKELEEAVVKLVAEAEKK